MGAPAYQITDNFTFGKKVVQDNNEENKKTPQHCPFVR